MSRLEDLIQTLCPDGVGYQKLGDICQIATGKLNVNKQSDNGKYPFFTCAKEVYRIDTFAFDTEALLISGNGNVGYIHYYNGKFNAYQRTYVLSNFSINIFFVKHVLEWGLKKRIAEGLRLGSVPYIRLETLRDFFIPLPPLPVQEEIVRILDTFSGVVTELEQKLEAEQAARVRQYEHYRDVLLMFDDRVIFKKLGEAGSFFGGLSGKTKTDFQNGNCKFITYMNVYKNPAVDTDINDYVKINPDERQNIVQFGDVLFTGSSETPEECGISSVMTIKPIEPYYLNSFTIGFRLHSPGLLTPDFSKHLFRSSVLRKQINKTANGVTRFNVSKAKLAEVIIPLPPLEVQEQIVSILDRFEILVNDLKSGLPAEIALRRKQYEYYRDKLLTFPAKQPPL